MIHFRIRKYLYQNKEVALIGLGCADKEVKELISEQMVSS